MTKILFNYKFSTFYILHLQTIDGIDIVAHGLAHGATLGQLPRHPHRGELGQGGGGGGGLVTGVLRLPALGPHHDGVVQLRPALLPRLRPRTPRSE